MTTTLPLVGAMSFFRSVSPQRRDPGRTPRYPRLPVWPRALLAVVAAGMVVVGGQWAAASYRDAAQVRHAPDCPAGVEASAPKARCVASPTALINGKDTEESCTGGGPPFGVYCNTDYRVQVSYSRRTDRLYVGHDTYRDVVRGDPAYLRTWHGTVVRMTVHGHTETYAPPSETAMFWQLTLIWLLLGLGIWSTISGYPGHLFRFSSLVWAFLAFPFSLIVSHVLLR
jgi:hypothetical protein